MPLSAPSTARFIDTPQNTARILTPPPKKLSSKNVCPCPVWQHPLLPRFKGQVLLAPAIKGNPPPPMLVAALRHLVVPLVPRWQIPSCLESGARSLGSRRNRYHLQREPCSVAVDVFFF